MILHSSSNRLPPDSRCQPLLSAALLVVLVGVRVLYNLVSEARLRRGPLQRFPGLARVDIYTPATGAVRPELTSFQLDSNEVERIASELRFGN